MKWDGEEHAPPTTTRMIRLWSGDAFLLRPSAPLALLSINRARPGPPPQVISINAPHMLSGVSPDGDGRLRAAGRRRAAVGLAGAMLAQ